MAEQGEGLRNTWIAVLAGITPAWLGVAYSVASPVERKDFWVWGIWPAFIPLAVAILWSIVTAFQSRQHKTNYDADIDQASTTILQVTIKGNDNTIKFSDVQNLTGISLDKIATAARLLDAEGKVVLRGTTIFPASIPSEESFGTPTLTQHSPTPRQRLKHLAWKLKRSRSSHV